MDSCLSQSSKIKKNRTSIKEQCNKTPKSGVFFFLASKCRRMVFRSTWIALAIFSLVMEGWSCVSRFSMPSTFQQNQPIVRKKKTFSVYHCDAKV